MVERVLIVDDDTNIVVSLEFLLQREGYQTLIAQDGEAALALARQAHPEIVLLDVQLPGLNGYEVCRQLREDPMMRGARIIMISARSRDTDISKGLDMGADAYLTKPFSTQALLDLIRIPSGLHA